MIFVSFNVTKQNKYKNPLNKNFLKWTAQCLIRIEKIIQLIFLSFMLFKYAC